MSSKFRLPSGKGLRLFIYGEEGSGKTELLAGIARLAPERFLYIDNEGSTTAFPMHKYTEAEPWGLIALSGTEPDKVQTLLHAELVRVRKGEGRYDAIAIDGLTEYNIAGQRFIVRRGRADDTLKEDTNKLSRSGWGTLLAMEIDMIQVQMELGTQGVAIFMTAGVMTEQLTKMPLVQGRFGDMIGRYFDLLIYVETITVDKLPKHKYHLLKTGAFRSKNRWEDVWLKQKYPAEIINTNLEQVMELVQKAAQLKHEGGINA